MVKAIIIEQNEQASAQLADVIAKVADDVNVVASFHDLDAAIAYLHTRPAVDIIFCSITVDGNFSFKVFDQTNVCTPVVFVTDEPEHMLKAFEYNCLAYLLKPLDPDRLSKAIAKYRLLYNREQVNNDLTRSDSTDKPATHVRHRMLVKKGRENISLPVNDIVLFHTEHRTVYVIDKRGREYTVDKNLCDIELEVDRSSFFRVNRQYIVNINFIHGYKPHDKVKLVVELTVPKLNHHFLVVSQEMAPQFREWMYNA
jgi:DNA-binding LytR/AlgR family response regulator